MNTTNKQSISGLYTLMLCRVCFDILCMLSWIWIIINSFFQRPHLSFSVKCYLLKPLCDVEHSLSLWTRISVSGRIRFHTEHTMNPQASNNYSDICNRSKYKRNSRSMSSNESCSSWKCFNAVLAEWGLNKVTQPKIWRVPHVLAFEMLSDMMFEHSAGCWAHRSPGISQGKQL